MYYTDSHGPVVWAYDFDPATGDIDHRRTFVDLSFMDGIVDGSTVDEEGCYWATIPFNEARYSVSISAGRLMRTDRDADRHPDLLRIRR